MNEPRTFLDALVATLARTSQYNQNDQVAPAAILWPDKERQWEPLIPVLRKRLPILTLGEYDPETHTGPSYYLRCMIARALPDNPLPPDVTPILYLPGISRQDLRAVEESPRHLQPLAELQYRGVLWTHKNGRDWTIAGFLQSKDGGLGIEVAGDSETKEALLRALPPLVQESLASLHEAAPLRAPYLDSLLNPDEVKRLLLWLNDPPTYRQGCADAEWTAFCQLCKHNYDFDPEADGEVTGGRLLGERQDAWNNVWQRFSEGPHAYTNLPGLLRRAYPNQPDLFETSPSWPQHNEREEASLRQSLLALESAVPAEARDRIQQMEEEHGIRRSWVWATLAEAPLAMALEHLVNLAQATENDLTGATVAQIADAYVGWGWQADAAVIDALAAIETAEDVAAIRAAIISLYGPWLDQSARAMQKAVADTPSQTYAVEPLPKPQDGTCIIFSDALRYDTSQKLAALLEQVGLVCQNSWRLAALPTVTATAKPAASPIAEQMTGYSSTSLTPANKKSGAEVNVATLRKMLAVSGYQVLQGDELGDPTGRAWTEYGAIDRYGHEHGWKVAHHLRAELRGLSDRIEALLTHGWQQITVVTDHGWLLLPGGLAKVTLPQHLTVTRKGRCALMKEDAQTDQMTVPWHWNQAVRIAIATGSRCYEEGKEYEHGGISPQECVVPVLTVSVPTSGKLAVSIESLSMR